MNAHSTIRTRRALLLVAGLSVLAYVGLEAHAEIAAVRAHSGFGADFEGTIWRPAKQILLGRSPYPGSIASSREVPSVYLPPVLVATAPFAWLPLQAATWVWFGILLAAALAVPFVLGVRNPPCVALWMLSLPVIDALVLGNASVLVALGCAFVWRSRDRLWGAAVFAAGAVALKFWLWPLLAWLVITRPRSGIRSLAIFAGATIASWAVIGFRGLVHYAAVLHQEAQIFGRLGVFFIGGLLQLNVPIKVAAALGALAGLALLGAAYARRGNDLQSFSIALLAALIATPVGWPHYLALPALSVMILAPDLSLDWAWFPALWVAFELGQRHGPVGQSAALTLFAVVPTLLVLARPGHGVPAHRRTTAMSDP